MAVRSSASVAKETETYEYPSQRNDNLSNLTSNHSPTPSTEPTPGCHPRSNQWWPSLFRIRPWAGIAAICISITSMLASVGILLGSEGAPVDSWHFTPSVYLAIATAVSNTALSAALTQAAPISWWYKAYKGCSVQDLELEWEAGQSFPRAIVRSLRQGRYFNLLTLSSLVVALVVIDGPLLQRASSVHSDTFKRSIVQNISITPELPTGFSGYWFPGDVQETRDHTIQIGHAFADGDPILSTNNCEGECAMKVQAPGIMKNDCTTKSWTINRTTLEDPSSTWGSQYNGNTPSKPFMVIQFYAFAPGMPMMNSAGPELVVMSMGRTSVLNFNGSYIETNCTLRSAIIEYDISLSGHEMTFASPPGSGRIIREATNTFLNTTEQTRQPLTWVAFQIFLSAYASANASFSQDVPAGQISYPKASSMNAIVVKHMLGADGAIGEFLVSDPTRQVFNVLNELMFRAGVVATSWGDNLTHLMDPGLKAKQTVSATQTRTLNVFRSDLRWFAGAAAIQIVAIILIVPVFYGWWELGLVDLTLSPFHLAKLFDAPLLHDVHSAAGAREIIRDVGNLHVKLGLVNDHTSIHDLDTNEKMSIEHRETIGRARLELAEMHRVQTPYKGLRFTQ